ncbi:MAG: hypothetical protein HY820_08150 [Acidobacteria bacterium]|nr:hypothetical protein [Acidobacteriota bacterium]
MIESRLLPHAPEELTRGKLKRLGEGIGKVVYASENWVVKRERSPSEVVALIVLWRVLRKVERLLPARLGRRLVQRPSSQIRVLRVLMQAAMRLFPRALWFSTHIQQVWKQYHFSSARGERLAREVLSGTPLIPEEVAFPPVEVRVGGWLGTLTVSSATERVETTLQQRLAELARDGRYGELELWLERLLELRKSGWSRGLFSLDAHLKNFGVVRDRVVLLDPGGLTDKLSDIERRLAMEEEVPHPHVRLGLEKYLSNRPEIAARFDARWKAQVNRSVLRQLWPVPAAVPVRLR